MQAAGVRVCPYINGRIFDKGTSDWVPSGLEAAAKAPLDPQVVDASTSLGFYNESYGSLAEFAVECPHTDYWQDTIAATVDTLVTNLGVDGVYIDQIAAAGPAPCWDPTHNHSLGGGSHWVTGYRKMLQKAREVESGSGMVILTESNAEPFMDGVDMYLTLSGFGAGDFAQSATSRIVPAFPAIYGGFVISMGAEFFTTDLDDDGDVFAARLAQQLLFGAQLGWMSLGGRSDNQSPPMGLFDLLMDEAHDEEVAFLARLSSARDILSEFFLHGRPSRDLALNISRTRRRAPWASHRNGGSGLEFDTIASRVWLDATQSALAILMVSVENNSLEETPVSFALNVESYGMLLDLNGEDATCVVDLVDLTGEGMSGLSGGTKGPCQDLFVSAVVPRRNPVALLVYQQKNQD